jgi:hypothetical protein
MVSLALAEKGWKQQTLAVAIGILDDGTTWDSTRVRRLLQGRARLEDHRQAVGRIIEVLDLDPPEAWHAAELKPPWMTEEDYRTSYAAAAQAGGTYRNKRPRKGTTTGQHLRAVA